MVRFPSHIHDGEGVITEVLGRRGEPGVDTLSIIREYNLPEHFADDVLEDARAQAEQFSEEIRSPRLDLTGETIITIDPVDARDFDDAISLVHLPGGHWKLGVHIADVSHFVRTRSALDREALNRATSVYLPDRVIPMLPEIISNGLASLQPDKVRFTKTVFIEFTADGARVAADPHSAAIRSSRRFTYEEVDSFLAEPESWRHRLTPEVHALLGRMHELAMILRARRFRRGSLELSMKEVKVDLDADGRVSARMSSRTPKAIRSSKSSCSRRTKPWPRFCMLPGCPFCVACILIPTRASSKRSTNSWPRWVFKPKAYKAGSRCKNY